MSTSSILTNKLSPTLQGDLTFNLFLDNMNVGQAYLTGFTLSPGRNSYTMTAELDVGSIVYHITQPGGPYPDGIVPITAKGYKCENNGREIPYLSKAISSLSLTYKLDLPDIVSSNAGIVTPLLGPLTQFVY